MAQKLLRHSDPKLTSNVYTRMELKEAHDAVDRIELPEDLE
jgi:integrase